MFSYTNGQSKTRNGFLAQNLFNEIIVVVMEAFVLPIPLSDLTTIGATFAPTSVRAKIFNIHFQRTYATESNYA